MRGDPGFSLILAIAALAVTTPVHAAEPSKASPLVGAPICSDKPAELQKECMEILSVMGTEEMTVVNARIFQAEKDKASAKVNEKDGDAKVPPQTGKPGTPG